MGWPACHTDLHQILNGTLNGVRCRDEILGQIVCPYAGAVGDDFILMDDNAPPYRSRLVNDYLDHEGIVRMDWPACSPDVNPIEHAWDRLRNAL